MAGAALVVAVLAAAVGIWVATGDDDDAQQVAAENPAGALAMATTDGVLLVVSAGTGEVQQSLPLDGPPVTGVSVDAVTGDLWWITDEAGGSTGWKWDPDGTAEPPTRRMIQPVQALAALPDGAVAIAPGPCGQPLCLVRLRSAASPEAPSDPASPSTVADSRSGPDVEFEELPVGSIPIGTGMVPRVDGDRVLLAPGRCPADPTDPDPTPTCDVPTVSFVVEPVADPGSETELGGDVGDDIEVDAEAGAELGGELGAPVVLPVNPDPLAPWELWALEGSTGWAVSAPTGCGGAATLAEVDLDAGEVTAEVVLDDELGSLRPAGRMDDGRVVLAARHGAGVGCPQAPSVVALWDSAAGAVVVVRDDVWAAAPWPSGLRTEPEPHTTTTTPGPTPTDATPPTTDEPSFQQTCSAEGLSVPAPQEGLPPDIQEVRTAVLEAATACDYDRLAALWTGGLDEDGTFLPAAGTYVTDDRRADDFAPEGTITPEATVAWWQQREDDGDAVLAGMVATLSSGYFCDREGRFFDRGCWWLTAPDDGPFAGTQHVVRIGDDGFAGWVESLWVTQGLLTETLLEWEQRWYEDMEQLESMLQGVGIWGDQLYELEWPGENPDLVEAALARPEVESWLRDDIEGVGVGPPPSIFPAPPPGWPARVNTEVFIERVRELRPDLYGEFALDLLPDSPWCEDTDDPEFPFPFLPFSCIR